MGSIFPFPSFHTHRTVLTRQSCLRELNEHLQKTDVVHLTTICFSLSTCCHSNHLEIIVNPNSFTRNSVCSELHQHFPSVLCSMICDYMPDYFIYHTDQLRPGIVYFRPLYVHLKRGQKVEIFNFRSEGDVEFLHDD
jgi:hypothetical protein